MSGAAIRPPSAERRQHPRHDLRLPVTVVAPGDTEIEVDADEIQAYVAPASVEEVGIARSENYSTVTTAQLAAQSGITNFSNFFVNDPNSAGIASFAVNR